ncbi:MAG: spore coat protein [Clostridia bacterium]|nr:spore coat protein [Clostridia bacterium]
MKQTKRDITLNEQDSLQDMLDCEKQLMGFYATALKEGSNKTLRKELMRNYTDCANGQFSVFEEMQTRGYYQTQPVQKQQLDAKIDSFKKIEKQLAQK